MLVLYCFIFFVIIISVLYLLQASNDIKTGYADNRIIYLIIGGIGLMYLYLYVYTGLLTGSTFFNMADVNLLFVAPISPVKILIYGLFSTIGKTLLASVFIFYQIPNLKNAFGYGAKEILALFFAYSLLVFINHILSIGIYVFSNGNQNRKSMVWSILYVFIGGIFLAAFLIYKKEQAGILETLYSMVDNKWFGYLPVVGWTVMLFKGVVTASAVDVIISLGMFIAVSVLCILMLTGREADYYEDVLYSTEITFQNKLNAKEGRNTSSNIKRHKDIKNEEHGINKGKGASVFIYKHLLEIKRSSRILFIDGLSIFTAVGVGIAGYFLKDAMKAYIILAVLIYFQYFITIFGKLKYELTKPYIYMIPESSFKKLLAASVSSFLKPCADAVIFFGVLAIVKGAGILQCLFMALTYIASGAVFIGLTVVYQRLFGAQPNLFAKIFIGFLLTILVITPGIVASVLITIYLLPENLYFMATLPYTLICLIMAFIMFFLCRNLIDKTEYSGRLF